MRKITVCFSPCCQNEHRNKKFCSRSCANAFTNQNSKKEKKPKYCKHCGKQTGLGYKSRTTCNDCKPLLDWSKATLADIRKNSTSHLYHSKIHYHSHKTYIKSDKPKLCLNCGYDRYYEVAHIKSISNFSQDTLVSIVNHLDNLIALCPNCHKEFDMGFIDLSKELTEGFAPT